LAGIVPRQRLRAADGDRWCDMSDGQIVQVLGNFVGAAMRDAGGFRFVALDVRLDELDGTVWPTFPELRWRVESAYRLSRSRQPETVWQAAGD
jgi:hypothetical protein